MIGSLKRRKPAAGLGGRSPPTKKMKTDDGTVAMVRLNPPEDPFEDLALPDSTLNVACGIAHK